MEDHLPDAHAPLDESLDTPRDVIDRSLAWARARGHPHYVWADIPIHAWRDALGVIERVSRALLTHDGRPVPLEATGTVSPRTLGVAAFTAGMGPLLGHWIEAGSVVAEPDVDAILRLHLRHNRRRTQHLRSTLADVVARLDRAGVTLTVIKGAHTGPAYFPEAAARPMADLDLVVDPADVDRAAGVLRAAGLTRAKAQSRPYKSSWVPTPVPALRSLEVTHAENPWAVELHTSLERDFHGVRTVRIGSLESGSTADWDGLGIPVRVLTQPTLLAYLALHTAEEFHHLQLLRLVELVLVARADMTEQSGWDRLSDLLERTRAYRFVYPAFALAEKLVPGTFDPRLLTRVRGAATTPMRRVVSKLAPADAQRLERTSLEERFMWAHGPIETLRRAARFLLPIGTDVRPAQLGPLWRQRLKRLIKRQVSVRDR